MVATVLSSFWRALGHIHLSIVLCLLITLDLLWGYPCITSHTTIFTPLNDVGLISWATTYGRYHIASTAWFFALLFLLCCFCVNMVLCTTDRVVVLLRLYPRLGLTRSLVKLGPHLMHYGIITILAGYLGSYLFSTVLPSQSLLLGRSLSLPDGTSITFYSSDPLFLHNTARATLEGRIIDPRAHLLISSRGGATSAVLSFNQPVRARQHLIVLKEYHPNNSRATPTPPRITFIVRRDSAIALTMAGIVLSLAGLLCYLWDYVLPPK